MPPVGQALSLPRRENGACRTADFAVLSIARRLGHRSPRHPPAARGKVSLTMIVRDEETNLPQCLESVSGLFDEIIIVDTGSRDRTVEIAR